MPKWTLCSRPDRHFAIGPFGNSGARFQRRVLNVGHLILAFQHLARAGELLFEWILGNTTLGVFLQVIGQALARWLRARFPLSRFAQRLQSLLGLEQSW